MFRYLPSKDATPPTDYVSLMIIPALFIIIPGVGTWLYKSRPKRFFKRYIKAIEAAADTSAQHKDEAKQRLIPD